MRELDDDELLEALGVEATPEKSGRYTPREERLIAGFEDILRFHTVHGRAPEHGEDRDIFERLYAVRLDRLLSLPEARPLLAPMDTAGLLSRAVPPAARIDELDDAALSAELGLDGLPQDDDITVLRHVDSFEDRRAAEDVASRVPCADFELFRGLFENVERDLNTGARATKRFGRDASVSKGSFFILGGQTVYVADMGPLIRTANGEPDARLRVIYSNGTESNLLMRSLQRALYKDETGRRLTEPNAGPLFGSELDENDIASGTIYVLRSMSEHPYVAANRELIHKIGVTNRKIETRIAQARTDPTYLLADVEVVASYAMANLSAEKLEGLIHRVFASAKLDLTIEDRFGNPVKPREWFLVPLQVIDEAVNRIRDGSILQYVYSAAGARLVRTQE